MKKFEKMTTTEFALFCLMAISSGLIIGIGGMSSLLALGLLGAWGRLVGACLFSLGIYAIVTYEMRLFTGMIADIPKMGVVNMWKLFVCFLCNILGVGLIAYISQYTFIAELITQQGRELIFTKLTSTNWAMNSLCSATLCGALITLSVWSVRYAPQKGVSSTVGVLFPIIVFAFCGFDHSIANMLYFFYLDEWTWQVFAYIALSVIGNVIGGVFLPLISLLKEEVKSK